MADALGHIESLWEFPVKGSLPIIPEHRAQEWEALLDQHGAGLVARAFVDALFRVAGPPFYPYSYLDRSEDASAKFAALIAKPWSYGIDTTPEARQGIEYKFDLYGDVDPRTYTGPVLTLGHPHNVISASFQEGNRMMCGGYDRNAPSEILKDPDAMVPLVECAIRFAQSDGIKGMSLKNHRAAFRLSNLSYLAPQFPVHVARAIYTGAANGQPLRTLDPSMGWGDRLAGFFCTQAASMYVGFDPNATLFSAYRDQCVAYDAWRFEYLYPEGTFDYLDHGPYPEPVIRILDDGISFEFQSSYEGGVRVTALCTPAEDAPWESLGLFNFVFTSPPYFGTERYASGTASEASQSWSRYQTVDSWHDQFFRPVISRSIERLEPGGRIAINVEDASIGPVRAPTGQVLRSLCLGSGLVEDPVMALRVKARPKKTPDGTESRRAEPIWNFRRP